MTRIIVVLLALALAGCGSLRNGGGLIGRGGGEGGPIHCTGARCP